MAGVLAGLQGRHLHPCRSVDAVRLPLLQLKARQAQEYRRTHRGLQSPIPRSVIHEECGARPPSDTRGARLRQFMGIARLRLGAPVPRLRYCSRQRNRRM